MSSQNQGDCSPYNPLLLPLPLLSPSYVPVALALQSTSVQPCAQGLNYVGLQKSGWGGLGAWSISTPPLPPLQLLPPQTLPSPPSSERLLVPGGELPPGGGGAGRPPVIALRAGGGVLLVGAHAGGDRGGGGGGGAGLLLEVSDDHCHVAHSDGQLLGTAPVDVLQPGPEVRG